LGNQLRQRPLVEDLEIGVERLREYPLQAAHARDAARVAGPEAFDEREILFDCAQYGADRDRLGRDREAHPSAAPAQGLDKAGPRGARDEYLLAAMVQNLRKLAKLLIRPPPDLGAMCIASP
jgi:hypothetical protein